MVYKNSDQIKLFVKDLNNIISGLGLLLKYCFSKDDITLALSLFSANSFIVRCGSTYTYEVIIVNNTDRDIGLKLMLDIYLKSNPVHPEGHYAYYVKNIFIKTHEVKHVDFSYNWENHAQFVIDGTVAQSDDLWRGICAVKGMYCVHALLLNEQHTCIDKLTIIQHLE